MIQLTLTLKMTTAQVVETSVTVNNNSTVQDYVHPDNQAQPTVKFMLWLITICHFNFIFLCYKLLKKGKNLYQG